ncbi:MAG: radical SAM protein [Pirellulales bacterium]|nr:radical SAM protein [Pirellulales bacterium]
MEEPTLSGDIMSNQIFGPVPSRRLGRSLGVDLVPLKTCTYDCIYCQLGPTTCKTMERKEWVPLDGVLEKLQEKLSTKPDYITLSGSGEPTLYSRVDELIDRIKAMTDVPVAVLTNGSLLWREDVRRQLIHADLVIPSLDAGDEAMFRLVNRPHEEISFEQMLSGLIDLRREFRGEYWLEVFVVGAYTAVPGELAKVAQCVDRIGPDRVQLNTVTRPPAEKYAVGVSTERLEELTSTFRPRAEIIADFRGVHRQAEFVAGREEILQMLRRRPCSIDDIAGGLDMHRNEVVKYIEELNAEDLLEESLTAEKLYYKVANKPAV